MGHGNPWMFVVFHGLSWMSIKLKRNIFFGGNPWTFNDINGCQCRKSTMHDTQKVLFWWDTLKSMVSIFFSNWGCLWSVLCSSRSHLIFTRSSLGLHPMAVLESSLNLNADMKIYSFTKSIHVPFDLDWIATGGGYESLTAIFLDTGPWLWMRPDCVCSFPWHGGWRLLIKCP